jgi:predicted TIM-barrel fold metal-dependent hydrolase
VPYCEGRLFYDADSHIMEMPDWLSQHVDPEWRDAIPPMDLSRIGLLAEQVGSLSADGRHDPATVAELELNVIGGAKGYLALGAANAAERSRALDLIGVQAQLVFSGVSVTQFLYVDNVDIKYAGARAHNRAMAQWCADDPRMLGVAIVPLHDPVRALAEAQYAVELGCKAFWLRAMPDGDRSPGHPDLDPFWELLADAGTPFIVHIGAQNQQIRPAYMNNGRPRPKDFLGGGEVMRGKDYTTFHQLAEAFLSALILDGVLDRFPTLKGAAIEFGCTWVPGWLQRVQHAAEVWGRTEPNLTEFSRSPRQQVLDQMTFTSLPFEDVGAAIRATSPELFMFGTDYPHVEGSRDPLGKMMRTLTDLDEDTLDKFFAGNFAKMMRLPATSTP